MLFRSEVMPAPRPRQGPTRKTRSAAIERVFLLSEAAMTTPKPRGFTTAILHSDREGGVEQEILRAADEYHADLIVMATAGHESAGDALRGDTTEHIVRRANCPVLAVPSTGLALERSTTARLATGELAI